jgi:glutamate 5-kinase
MKKHIVVKFGSGVLTTDASGLQLDRGQFARLAGEIAALVDAGHSVIVISSAAVANGVRRLVRNAAQRISLLDQMIRENRIPAAF